MKKYNLLTYTAFLLMPLVSNAQTAGFDETQKAEIGQVVHDYIISHPEVITEAVQVLQAKEMKAWEEKAKQAILNNMDGIFNSKSPNSGAKSPKVSVVEFFDYNCPHCKVMQKTLNDILSDNKDVLVVYKELPVLNEGSLFAAKAALAAREQNKYNEFHDKMMTAQEVLTEDKILALAKEIGLDIDKLNKDMASSKVNDELTANRKIAMDMGLRGTPAFVFGKYPATKDMKVELLPGEVQKQDLIEKIKSYK
ncbi:MAG: DsbA family protein [Proteobacteria bacterium]|nr:DsbA family protein [Pseudomonadota bacterium]